MRYIPFRLFHKRNFANELLYRMKIVDSPECPPCINIPETIGQAFIECQKTHILWRQVRMSLDMVLKDNIKISDSEKIFGTPCKNSIIDTVILSAKKKTYKQ